MNRRSVFYWVIGIIIAAILIIVAFEFDEPVQQLMLDHQNRPTRAFMEKVSQFGDWPEHFAIGLVLLLIAWSRGSKKWMRIFLAMLIALSIAGVADRAIKVSTGRARPSVKSEHAWNGLRLTGSKYHSFPSGHVSSSTAFFGVLLLTRRRIGLACLPIPALIGFARMYIGAHWLSDVVCGAVLGMISALIVAHWLAPKDER